MSTMTDTNLVVKLREKTGAGMMDCKKALVETGGDAQKAEESLRIKGIAKAGSKGGRTAAEGLVGSYIHMGGKIGVLVELNCESDFVARTEDFQNLVKEVAMHIAAADPKWVRREDVPAEAIEKEKAIYRAQMENTWKPAHVLDKIVEGKLGSFYAQFVLLDQPSIREPKMTVAEVLAAANKTLGTQVTVTRFDRLKVGETA